MLLSWPAKLFLQPFSHEPWSCMVIGNGMVAQAFATFRTDERVIVFASGVSRSSEIEPSNYQRELDLLSSLAGRKGRLVYFSTVSLFDPTLQDSSYIQHKRNIEEVIRRTFPDHLIIRLPNLVGNTRNPFTLTNFLRDRIQSAQPFELHTNACRFLMDVDDMVIDLSPFLTDPTFSGITINACGTEAIALPALLGLMEKVLDRKAKCLPVHKGSCYPVDTRLFMAAIPRDRREAYALDRTEVILRKYYGTRLTA